jgi:hypothetical protein
MIITLPMIMDMTIIAPALAGTDKRPPAFTPPPIIFYIKPPFKPFPHKNPPVTFMWASFISCEAFPYSGIFSPFLFVHNPREFDVIFDTYVTNPL